MSHISYTLSMLGLGVAQVVMRGAIAWAIGDKGFAMEAFTFLFLFTITGLVLDAAAFLRGPLLFLLGKHRR